MAPSSNPEYILGLLLTCEHATNSVPDRWAHRFSSPAAQAALQSHRGWDPGAAELALFLAASPTADLRPPPPVPCILGTATRLLVELNRSPNHPQFWSEFTRDLPAAEKEEIVRKMFTPFRRAAHEAIERLAGFGPVYHLSVHTFSPELDGAIRDAEIGLLYDPARPLEIQWADRWEQTLAELAPGWRVRRNYPYLGTDDGHTTHLRTQYPAGVYAGLELEVNQALVQDASRWPAAQTILRQALRVSI